VVEALQAGKHVFCQKPLSLTLEENRLARAAAEKHPHLQFFIGTQQRSQKDLFLRAVNMVHKGLLGDITKVTVGINGSPTGGPFSVVQPPRELDWEMWLGPAPMVDYREKRCHYEYRWWYEYSGGKFTDWGAHHVDIAQWALREDSRGKGPTKIDGSDAKHPVPFKDGCPTVEDCYNTSHDFAVKCTFPSGVEMVIDSRSDNGILFEGTKGRIFVNREKITGRPIEEEWDKDRFTEADVVELYKGKPFEDHKQNFYRCIREGGLPVSDVFSHIMAMNTCHLSHHLVGSGDGDDRGRRSGGVVRGPHAATGLRDSAGVIRCDARPAAQADRPRALTVRGSGLPVPRRRTFVAPILGSTHSDAACASPSWLRLSSYAGSGARASGLHRESRPAVRPNRPPDEETL
jgi:predicted dehydrogenase